MAKQDKKTARDVGKKLFDDITDSSVDARNVVDEFYKNLQKGGKAAQPILNELSKLFSKAGDATQKASKAVDNFNDSISKGKKEFDSLQKTLATYDGPRFKAAGMITEELSNQLSYNEMIAKSKEILNALDKRSTIYSKLLSDSSQEYTKLVNESANSKKALTDTIVESYDLQKQLNTLLEEENVLKDLQTENETRRFDLVQKINQEADPVKRNKLENELLLSMQEGLDLEGELFRRKQDINKVNKSIQDNSTKQVNLQEKLDELAANRVQTEKDVAFQTAINNDATGRLRATFENINKITGEQISSQGTLAKKMQEVEDSAYKVGTAQFRQIDLTDDINDKLKEQKELDFARTAILDETNGLLPEQREEALALIDANIKINQEQLKQAQALQASAEAYETVNDKANALRDSMMAPVDKLFGLVPDNISNMLGLGKIQDELKEKVGASISNAFMSASGPMTGFFSAATAGAGTLMATLAPILPLLLAIAGVVALVKMFADADAEVAQLSKDLGVSYQQAIKVKESAVDIATEMGSVVVTAEQVTQAMVDLKKATGMNLALVVDTNKAAKNFVETSALLATHFGMTAEESVELNQSAAILGTTIDKIGVGADMMGDELMSSTEIMKTIGKTSKSILFNFKGNVGALMAAVKQAKMMGTTLDKVAAAGDKLLDIESSLVAESKVRVMLGRNISLDAARYYALTGQTEKLMEELKKQAGSVAEYEKMAPMQRKMLADALGMSNDELAEMMAKEKELQLLGYDANELEEIRKQAKAGQLDIESKLKNMTSDAAKEKLIEIANEEKRAGIQERLMKSLTKIQDLLFNMINPLLPVIDAFVDSLGSGQGILTSISGMFSGIGNALKIVVEVATSAFSAIMQFLQPIIGILGQLATSFSQIGNTAGGIGTTIKDIGAAIATYFFANIMATYYALVGLVEGLMPLVDGILGLIAPILDIFSSTEDKAGGLTDIILGIGSAIQTIFKYVGYIFSAILTPLTSLIKGVLEPLKGLFGKIIDAFSPITELFKSSGKDGKSFLETLKPILDIFQMIGTVLGTIIAENLDVVINAVKQVMNVLAGLWDILAGVFTLDGDRILKGLEGIGGAIIDLLTYPFKKAFDWIMKLFGGNSPSELGLRIVDGISSIGSMLIDALLYPFKIVWDFIGNMFGMGELGSSIIDGVKSIFSEVGKYITSILSSTWDIVTGLFTLDFDKVFSGFSDIGDTISDAFSNVSELITKAISYPFEKAISFVTDIFGKDVGGGIGKVLSGIKAAITTFILKPFEYFKSLFSGISKMFSGDFVGGIKEIGGAVIQFLLTPFKMIGDFIDSVFGTDIVSSVTDVFSSIGDSIIDIFSGVWDTIVGIFTFDGDKILGGLKNIGNSILAIFQTAWNGVMSMFGGVGESIVNGISSVGSSIVDSITAPFTQAWDNISGWLGFSPSELGNGIVKGISSIGGDIESNLTKPFENAEQKVADSAKGMADSMSGVSGTASISIQGLDTAGISQIKDIEKDLRRIKVDAIKEKLEELSDAFNAMDWALLKEFSNLANVSLDEAGKSLIGGINSLTGISKSVNLDSLKDTFEDLSDTLDELDWESLKTFATLATTNLSEAGNSLIGGINSLTGISKEVNLSALEDTFSDLMDTLDELDWDILKTFATLATTNLSDASKSIIGGINSLTGINKEVNLGALEDTFADLTDTLDELDWESLKAFASLASGNLENAGTAIINGIKSLATINEEAIDNLDLSGAEEAFSKISDVLGNLDTATLSSFSQINATGVGSVIATLTTSIGTLSEIGDKSDALDAVTDTFDSVNDVLSTIDIEILNEFATANLSTLGSNVTAISTAMESLAAMGTIDLSGVSDKGKIMSTFLNNMVDIDYENIDGLAQAILNLSASYSDLAVSIKDITDEDIARIEKMSSITSTPTSGSLSSSLSKLFGFGESEEIEETATPAQPVTTPAPVTPIMQPTATITPAVTATAPVTNTVTQSDNKKLEDLLRELIAKVDQPVIMKIGEKAVSEISNQISIRKSYSANMNTGRA